MQRFLCQSLLITKYSINTSSKHFIRYNTNTNSYRQLSSLSASSSASVVVMTKEKAIEILRNADAVCFDVDSTVIDEEGVCN